MTRTAVLAFAVLVAEILIMPPAAAADDMAACRDRTAPATAVAACTRLIDAARLPAEQLAEALRHRAGPPRAGR